MQCENCKKKPATAHMTEMSHQKVKKEVHLCEECMRIILNPRSYMQCEKCKKKSAIVYQIEIGHPNAKPKTVYFCEECIKEVQDRLQCKKCKGELGSHVSVPQDIRSKMVRGGGAMLAIGCKKCSGDSGDTGTSDLTFDYPE